MFYRKIEQKLYKYYGDKNAKIIVVDGARQIGKSFIIRETAKKSFAHYVEINLKDDYDGDQLFLNVKTEQDFYLQVSALYGDNLNSIDDTIIFLDEIQNYPHLLTLLKALKQDGRYRYICSGSLLGITLKHTFIPMGSIEEVKMYPMDFEEFLIANRVGLDVFGYLGDYFLEREEMEDGTTVSLQDGLHKRIIRLFKEYLISGGLPDSVKAMVIEKNIQSVRNNQAQTFNYYKDDASKYDEEHSLKIRRILDLLPSYMENKVKRVQATKIAEKRSVPMSRYEDEFDYLLNSGCTLGVNAISNPKFPLNESVSKNLIKLYFNDVGILTNILYRNNIQAILDVDKGVNLGSVYETAVAMELTAHGHEPYYFDSKKVGEVDFLINDYDSLDVLPIEVKSGADQYTYRAIPKLVDPEGNYRLKKGIVFGNENVIKRTGNLYVFPVYMVMFL